MTNTRLIEAAKEILLPKIKEKVLVERAKLQSFILNMAKEGKTSAKYGGYLHDMNKKYLENQNISFKWTDGQMPSWMIWEPGYLLTINISEEDLSK